MLRAQKVRQASIKYLSKRLKKTYEVLEENDDDNASSNSSDDDEDEDIKGNILPNFPEEKGRSTILDQDSPDSESNELHKKLSAADAFMTNETTFEVQQLQQSNTIKDGEEEINLTEEIGDQILIDYPNKSSLVLNALIASLEDEFNLTQRLTLDFLYSHFKLAGNLFNEQEKCILIEATLNLLIRKDLAITRRVYTWLFGPPDLENKYQITEKNEFVLRHLITAFQAIFQRVPLNSLQASLPLKVLQNFYMEHDHLVDKTLNKLSIPLLSYIQKYSTSNSEFMEEVQKAGVRFMENIASYFSTILNSLSEALDEEISKSNNEGCLEIINLIEFTFKLEASIANKEDNIDLRDKSNYLKAIISGILRSTSSIAVSQLQSTPFIKIALTLNMNLIDKLILVESALRDTKEPVSHSSNQIIDYSEEEYQKIDQEIEERFEESLKAFANFFNHLVETINNKETQIELGNKILTLYSISAEMIIKTQKFHTKKTMDHLPEWFNSIVESIKSSFPSFAIIGINTMLEILVSDGDDVIFKSFRKLIANEARQNPNLDYVRLTMEKLWNLLDIHYFQNKVTELILKFQNYYPNIFADTISSSFQVPSITEKESAIRRFASFWKLSSDFQQNSNNIFIQSGIGLFIMLDFLDNDNPLLRHTSKSWLLDSIPHLYRVIDPIFEVLMQVPTGLGSRGYLSLYVTDSKQYFFTEIYDTRRVSEAFKKLKSILITANELFIRYISTIKVSERLKIHKQFFLESQNDAIKKIEDISYCDLLVNLCLKYIRGHAIESLSPQFQIENSSVNASSCEFLELLITHLENKELSASMTHYIIEPLLVVLSHAIGNNDYVMQVQILNLLKVILFQSSFCNLDEYKSKTINILSNNMFIPNLLEGLKTEMPYVRVQFINFISMCISILTENLKQNELSNCILKILSSYFQIILKKNLEKAENANEFDAFDCDNWTFDNEDTSANAKKIKMEGDNPVSKGHTDINKLAKTGGGGNTFSLRYQNQNEIFIVLDGVKKILQFFLKFKSLNDERSGDKTANAGVFDYMKDILSFNLFFRGQEIKKEVFNSQFPDTCKAILDLLHKFVFIYIYCWRLSREFREWSDFTPSGIIPYSFEKYNEINKNLKDMHMKIDPNSKNVRSQIISVMKPLFYQYTAEAINAFLNYWIKICEDPQINQFGVCPKMMKEIEILVTMNIPVETFLNALAKNNIILTLSTQYTKRTNTSTKKNPYVLNYQTAVLESRIFYLIYTYISFAYIDISFLKRDNLIRLWTTIINFVK